MCRVKVSYVLNDVYSPLETPRSKFCLPWLLLKDIARAASTRPLCQFLLFTEVLRVRVLTKVVHFTNYQFTDFASATIIYYLDASASATTIIINYYYLMTLIV